MPHFSIIIPLYNKAPYVRKTVESVIGQTYHDWELVVVDDGSTDGGGDIVKGFDDHRIRLIRQENSGVSAARNNGVAASTTPYITFLDADDWWEPTFLEEMAGLIERYPDAGIYGTNYYIVKNGKKRVAPIGVDKGFSEGVINYCQVYAKTLCMPLTSISICMPRRVFNEMGGFPEGIKLGEDFLLWVHVALKYSVVLLNKPLANYDQDVDATNRSTSHLHAPKESMFWQLDGAAGCEMSNEDYKVLRDRLITSSMVPYILKSQYRNDAKQLLSTVDWDNAMPEDNRMLHFPLPILKIYYYSIRSASTVKQWLKKHIYK